MFKVNNKDTRATSKTYTGGTQVKLEVWVEIGTLVGGVFSIQGFENSLYKKQ